MDPMYQYSLEYFKTMFNGAPQPVETTLGIRNPNPEEEIHNPGPNAWNALARNAVERNLRFEGCFLAANSSTIYQHSIENFETISNGEPQPRTVETTPEIWDPNPERLRPKA